MNELGKQEGKRYGHRSTGGRQYIQAHTHDYDQHPSWDTHIPMWVEPTLISLLQQRLESIHDEILRATKDLPVIDLDAKCKTSPNRKIPS